MGIVLISSDLEEVLACSHRVGVTRAARIGTTLAAESVTAAFVPERGRAGR